MSFHEQTVCQYSRRHKSWPAQWAWSTMYKKYPHIYFDHYAKFDCCSSNCGAHVQGPNILETLGPTPPNLAGVLEPWKHAAPRVIMLRYQN